MTYVFLAVVAVTIDNMCMGYLLTKMDLLSMVFIWVAAAAIVGLVISLFTGVKKSEIVVYAQHPIKTFLYFVLSVLGILFWAQSIIILGVGSASILSKLGVLIPILWGVLIFQERLSLVEYISGATLLCGVLIFSWKGGLEMQQGILYTLASTVCYSFQKVLSKDLSDKISPQFTIFLRSLIIALSILCIFWVSSYSFLMPSLDLLLIAILGGVIGGFFNKYFMFKAYQVEDLTRVMLFYSTKPIAVFVAAIFLLQEPITWLKAVGGLIIITSVMVLWYQHTRQKEIV